MTLDDFKSAMSNAGAPVQSISGDDKGLNIILTDKRKITVKRQRIKDCATDADMQTYVRELL